MKKLIRFANQFLVFSLQFLVYSLQFLEECVQTGFENLEVWKKSIILVKEVYILVKFFPKEENYALSDQVRRCAVSVPSNIAEGSGRNSPKEFVQFLYIALGSINELETQLIIAKEIGYLKDIEEIRNKILEIKKMLNSLITSIKRKHGN